MKYISYSLEDFIKDEDFVRWVKKPTPESDFFWRSLMTEFSEKSEVIEKAREIVELLSIDEKYISDYEVDKLRDNLLRSIREEEGIPDHIEKPVKTLWQTQWIKIAAVILLLMAFGIGIQFLSKKVLSEKNGRVLIYRENPNGQRSSLILSDGTKVWLNGGSKLKYYSNYDGVNERRVFLEGEAFFDVSKDKSKPFIVSTQLISVKVLGTSFNVRSYSEDETVETTLVEGQVELNNAEQTETSPNKNILMKPNQKAIFSKRAKIIKLYNVDTEVYTSWKDGKLIIEDETFEKAISKLERWYGVELNIQEGKDCRISAKIGNESLTEVLELFKLTTKINYETIDNEIYIRVKCETL